MLIVRLATAAILIPILLVVLWVGGPVLGVTIALVVLLAAVETADLLRRAGLPANRLLLVALALTAVAEAAIAGQPGSGIGAWLVPAWLLLAVGGSALAALIVRDMRLALLSWAATAFGGLYVGLLAFLLRLPLTASAGSAEGPLVDGLDAGRAWLLLLVLGVWAYDTGAYVVGRLWGRGRFFAHVSPHKTWSGTAGGTLCAVAACAVIGAVIGRPAEAAGLGLIVALTAPVGDLSESVLKRAAGVKDSGQLIPGHGGMLDRVDSFVFSAPAAWLYLFALGLV